ncbi:MAG: helicase [Bacteroidales bacterium]|nr:helicase [Bacteroidales bacterium]
MQIQIFSIPILGGEEMMQELNRFLRANRVSDIQKSITETGGTSYWTFCITYLPQTGVKAIESETRKGKIDYREVLDEPIFARFCEFRKVRKQIAEEQSIPPFAVFTDAELAEIAKLETVTVSSMKSIQGIGTKKAEKYGEYFIIAAEAKKNEESGEPD